MMIAVAENNICNTWKRMNNYATKGKHLIPDGCYCFCFFLSLCILLFYFLCCFFSFIFFCDLIFFYFHFPFLFTNHFVLHLSQLFLLITFINLLFCIALFLITSSSSSFTPPPPMTSTPTPTPTPFPLFLEGTNERLKPFEEIYKGLGW